MEQADLISWHRSVAMAAPRSTVSAQREQLLDVLDELISVRTLLSRLGADIKSVARRAP